MLAGIGIVLVAATACGQRPTSVPAASGGPAPAGSSVLVPPSSQTPPAGSVAVPPAQLDTAQLPADYPREVYVSADGRTLYLRAQEGGCARATAEVRESPAQVAVVLVETKPNLAGQMCTMDIRYPLVPAPLAAPLEQRKIVLSAERRGY